MTISIGAVIEARAKMTPGAYELADDGALIIEQEHDVAGLVATHNAADVLLEVVRTLLVERAAEMRRQQQLGREGYQGAVRSHISAQEAHDTALAKVTL